MRKGKKKLKSLLASILVGVMFLTMNPATVFAEGGDSPSATQIGEYKLTEDAELQRPTFLPDELVEETHVGVIKLPSGTNYFHLYTGIASEGSVNVNDDYGDDGCVNMLMDGQKLIFRSVKTTWKMLKQILRWKIGAMTNLIK